MDQRLLENLLEWLAIPSISTGGGDPADLVRAARFVVDRVREAGGEAELVTIGDHHPIAVGELQSADPQAPTVILYGHYDVQSVEPLEDWTTERNPKMWAATQLDLGIALLMLGVATGSGSRLEEAGLNLVSTIRAVALW